MERTPLQIILIEQVLNSVYVIIFVTLYIAYGAKLLASLDWFSSTVSTYIYVGILCAILFAWFYLLIPYTCVRIWKSAKEKHSGFKCRAYQIYAVIIGSFIILPLVAALLGNSGINRLFS
ncbi:hypothetical protein [Bermanella sp. R86510]|uniref:hypothetical protein n=1 Tax=unclassified Bermanella TaxID=2627862 RepID=UPI0037C86BD4